VFLANASRLIATILATAPVATAAAASASVATSTAAMAAPPSAMVLSRTRFIYDQGATHEFLAVQRLDRAVRFFIITDFNKSKTTQLSGHLVAHKRNVSAGDPALCEPIIQILLVGLKRQIADV
jgi:hypothetical protein